MKAVSFMYVRPPGYNAESAKAAEIADESAREHPQTQALTDATATSTSRYHLHYILPSYLIAICIFFQFIFVRPNCLFSR